MRELIIALLLATAGSGAARAGDLTVTISGLKDARGAVLGALYDKEASFMNPAAAIARFKVAAATGSVSYSFHNLAAGAYALSVFQDQNSDGALNKNMMGAPSEPYGFSNDAQGQFGPPKFRQAAFAFDGKTAAIAIDLNH
jgi:uncharacterized protein (DUF2141 family)